MRQFNLYIWEFREITRITMKCSIRMEGGIDISINDIDKLRTWIQ